MASKLKLRSSSVRSVEVTVWQCKPAFPFSLNACRSRSTKLKILGCHGLEFSLRSVAWQMEKMSSLTPDTLPQNWNSNWSRPIATHRNSIAVHSPPSLSICELETWKARDRAVSINPHKFTEVHTTSYNFIQFPNDTHVMRFFAGQRLEILMCLSFSVRSSVWFSVLFFFWFGFQFVMFVCFFSQFDLQFGFQFFQFGFQFVFFFSSIYKPQRRKKKTKIKRQKKKLI